MGTAGTQWTSWKGIVLTGTNGSEPALPVGDAQVGQWSKETSVTVGG